MTTRRKRKPTPARRHAAGRRRRLLSGERVYGLLLAGVVAVIAAMALGPLQSYTAAADRVDELTETHDHLSQEVQRLEERRERLHDPEEIELMARAEQGLVKPGEVPFVVVPDEEGLDGPHADDPEAGGAGAGEDGAGEGPWHRRLGRWLADLMP